jgi:hypothetical protein
LASCLAACAFVVFISPAGSAHRNERTILSCPWPRVQSVNTIGSDDTNRDTRSRVSPHPSLRFSCPTAREAGRSDLYRDCLPRLSCVFRLSQPLDALLRFRPSRLVSSWWRSWASRLQRFSLSGSECHLPMAFALLAVGPPVRDRSPSASRICAPAKSVALGPGLIGYPQLDPLLTFSLRGIVPRRTRPHFVDSTKQARSHRLGATSIHGLRYDAERPKPPITTTALQRVKDPTSRSTSFKAPLPPWDSRSMLEPPHTCHSLALVTCARRPASDLDRFAAPARGSTRFDYHMTL